MRNLGISVLLLSPLALAQQKIVSPNAAATVDGSTSNAFPWTGSLPKRYMQIHSDVGGSPKVISKIAGRMNGTTTAYAGTRNLDIELFMGNSVAWNQCSFVISKNYIGASTQVVTRQVINMGPFGAGSPAPFDFAIPLTTPYVYTGVNSLAWEMLQYSNTAVGSAPGSTDVDAGSISSASVVLTGPGCIAGGQTLAMTHVLSAADVSGTFTFGFYLANAPANAPTVLYLGTTNPNQTVPGLCGPLYTDLVAAIPLGITDANGYIGSKSGTANIAGGPAAWTFPNTFPGAVIYTQVHSIDTLSTSSLPFANSDGRMMTVPAPNTTKTSPISRIYSNDTQTALYAHYFNTLSVGYGAVMEFTY